MKYIKDYKETYKGFLVLSSRVMTVALMIRTVAANSLMAGTYN